MDGQIGFGMVYIDSGERSPPAESVRPIPTWHGAHRPGMSFHTAMQQRLLVQHVVESQADGPPETTTQLTDRSVGLVGQNLENPQRPALTKSAFKVAH